MKKISTGSWNQGPTAFGRFIEDLSLKLHPVGAVITGIAYTITDDSGKAGYCLTIEVDAPDVEKIVRIAHDRYS